MTMKNKTINNFPEWAINYLFYDDKQDLTEEDIKNVDDWKKENNFYSLWGFSEEHFFSSHPAFGLPCVCVTITFGIKE